MADKRISQLPTGIIPLTGNELVPLVQDGATIQATSQDIANLAPGGGGGGATITAFALVNNVGDFITPQHPGVDSVTWSCGSPGIYQINFSDPYFASDPAIACGMIENVPQVTYEIISFDATQCTIRIFEIDTKNPIDMPFTITAVGLA